MTPLENLIVGMIVVIFILLLVIFYYWLFRKEDDPIKNCDVILTGSDGSIVFKKSFLFGNRRIVPYGGGYIVLEQDGSVKGSQFFEKWEPIE